MCVLGSFLTSFLVSYLTLRDFVTEFTGLRPLGNDSIVVKAFQQGLHCELLSFFVAFSFSAHVNTEITVV